MATSSKGHQNSNKRSCAAVIAGLVLVSLVGCGKEPSIASKSATAFRTAQKEGKPLGGGAHGHGALTPGESHEMPDTTSGASADGHGMAEGGMAGMDHSGAKGGMAGMDHAAGGSGSAGHEMGGGMAPGMSIVETVSPGQPAKTLRPDALDAPATTSVVDAQRSAEMSEGMKGMGGHGGGTYRQVDAGRGPGADKRSEPQTPAADPHQHGPAIPPPAQEGDHSQHEPPDGGGVQDVAEIVTVYACSMHPEVTSADPGKCPKCGMTLVKRRKG